MDVHGAGAQRSDPKSGDPADWPYGHGPQGDVVRIYSLVRLVRDKGDALWILVTLPGDDRAEVDVARGQALRIARALGPDGNSVLEGKNLLPQMMSASNPPCGRHLRRLGIDYDTLTCLLAEMEV